MAKRKKKSPYLVRRCKEQGITRGAALKRCMRREAVASANMNRTDRRNAEYAEANCRDEGFTPKSPSFFACVDEQLERRRTRAWGRKSGR